MSDQGSVGAARGYLVAGACILAPIWLTAVVRAAFWVGGGHALSAEAAGASIVGGVCLGVFSGFVYAVVRYAP